MGSTWEQEVRAREEENRLAFLEADVATLDRLWTEDFTLALLETARIRHTTMAVEKQSLAARGSEWRCFARHANLGLVRREPTT